MLNKIIRLFWHKLEPVQVRDHLPVQLPQPDWRALRERAAERHGKPFRCDTLIEEKEK